MSDRDDVIIGEIWENPSATCVELVFGIVGIGTERQMSWANTSWV
jgi:hypothetical protein